MLKIICPHCKETLRIDEGHVGLTARCRFCRETFVIQRPSPAARLHRMLVKSAPIAAIVTAVAALFSFSLPVAVAYWAALVSWMVLKRSKRLLSIAGAAILGPITFGLGLVVWTMVGLELTVDADPGGPRWLAPGQAFFLDARDLLVTAKSLSLFLFALAAAAVVHNFWPRTQALKRVLTLKGHVGRAWLAVATVTTFTFVTAAVGTAEADRLEKSVDQRYQAALRARDAANQRVDASAAVAAEAARGLQPEDAAVYYALYKLAGEIADSDGDTANVWIRTSAPVPERVAARVTREAFTRMAREPGAAGEPRARSAGPPRPPPPAPIDGAADWRGRERAARSFEREARKLDAVAAQNEAAVKKAMVEAAGKVFSEALKDVPFGEFVAAFLKKTLDVYSGRVPPGTVLDAPRRFARFLMSREVVRGAFATNLERQLLDDARAHAGRGQWSTALERLELVQGMPDSGTRRAAQDLYPEYLYGRAEQLEASGRLAAARDEYRRVAERHGSTRWAADARRNLTKVEAALIAREVAKIRDGPHAELGTPVPSGPSGRRGRAAVQIQNGTEYTLTVLFSGPTARSVTLGRGRTETVWLATGSYGMSARVSDPRVRPYAGGQTYQESAYAYRFVIERVSSRGGGLMRIR